LEMLLNEVTAAISPDPWTPSIRYTNWSLEISNLGLPAVRILVVVLLSLFSPLKTERSIISTKTLAWFWYPLYVLGSCAEGTTRHRLLKSFRAIANMIYQLKAFPSVLKLNLVLRPVDVDPPSCF
jgi:hypothetical protein